MPVSFEVERGPNEGPGLTTTNIIQRLEQGENFSSIVDQFELPSVDEVLALRPDEPMGISVADVLKRLNAVRVRAGTLHNAVLGYLQHDANEPVVQEIARAADWRDLKGFNDPRGYDELLRSRIYLVGYAPTAHEFICSTSSLRHVGTTSACVRLGERDPAWQSCAREVKRCKIAAHVGMRQVLGDIRLGPGPADTLDSAIDEIEWSMRTGSLPVVEGKKAILDLARQASGFRVPQKVMNLAAHKEVETLRLVRGTVLYSERGLVGLLNRTDNAAAMFQVVFGFVALHRILGESPERVIPHILTHDLGTLATYMTGTGPDMPFI